MIAKGYVGTGHKTSQQGSVESQWIVMKCYSREPKQIPSGHQHSSLILIVFIKFIMFHLQETYLNIGSMAISGT